jgi:hypothetical protein
MGRGVDDDACGLAARNMDQLDDLALMVALAEDDFVAPSAATARQRVSTSPSVS